MGDYRFGLWPLQATDVKDIEACNRKLMSFILGLRPEVGESKESFCIRRSRAIKHNAGIANIDLAGQWALKTVTWLEHLQRHPICPAARLLADQTPEWLETCRILAGMSLFYPSDRAGVTMTRGGAGKPVRYLGQWWRSMTFDNAARDKALSRARAEQLRAFCKV